MSDNPQAPSSGYADTLREHGFDGIVEYDNHLPRWWLWSFYLACVFALAYWLYYQGFAIGDTAVARFEKELAAAEARHVAVEATDDALIAAASDPAIVEAGREVFASTCIGCHGMNGASMPGGIGPNLTDNAWIHGGAPSQIHHTVHAGVTGTAMVAWGAQLGPTRVQQVVAYLLSIRNTDVEGGKPAEGEPYSGL